MRDVTENQEHNVFFLLLCDLWFLLPLVLGTLAKQALVWDIILMIVIVLP